MREAEHRVPDPFSHTSLRCWHGQDRWEGERASERKKKTIIKAISYSVCHLVLSSQAFVDENHKLPLLAFSKAVIDL